MVSFPNSLAITCKVERKSEQNIRKLASREMANFVNIKMAFYLYSLALSGYCTFTKRSKKTLAE